MARGAYHYLRPDESPADVAANTIVAAVKDSGLTHITDTGSIKDKKSACWMFTASRC